MISKVGFGEFLKRCFWSICFGALFVLALGHLAFHQFLTTPGVRAHRQQLISLASRVAGFIDGDELLKIPLTLEGDTSPQYQDALGLLSEVKKQNPLVKYIYVLTNTGEPGVFQYVVDADPLPEIVTARSPKAFPGDLYDGRAVPALLSAFDGPSADKGIVKDVWGATLSGYAPVLDSFGGVVGIVGVDMDASVLEESLKISDGLSAITAAFGVLFLLALLFPKLSPPRKGTL
ncbi:MAG: hypothetical protein WC732_03150 [Candidatus Omnitrophota bacterium]